MRAASSSSAARVISPCSTRLSRPKPRPCCKFTGWPICAPKALSSWFRARAYSFVVISRVPTDPMLRTPPPKLVTPKPPRPRISSVIRPQTRMPAPLPFFLVSASGCGVFAMELLSRIRDRHCLCCQRGLGKHCMGQMRSAVRRAKRSAMPAVSMFANAMRIWRLPSGEPAGWNMVPGSIRMAASVTRRLARWSDGRG